MWNNPANWDWGTVLRSDAGGVVLAPTTNGSVSTIAATDVFNINGPIYGPEWGMTLNIYGSLSTISSAISLSMLGNSAAPSTINMFGNSSLDVVDMLFGDNWWFEMAPYVALNMYGGAQLNCTDFWWGGHVSLYDNSIITATGGWTDRTTGLVSDSTKQINLLGGTLVLPSGNSANITNYIGRGIFLVYGKAYDTNEVIIINNGTNTVVTVPSLGALQSISLRSSRGNMMVGTFQDPMAMGNFANVQDVPLTVLDAAQLGGGTLTYDSSDPNVVGVTTNGHVTAIKPGNATVSAALGSVTSTDSVLITVTPYTNSLIHQYSFSESGGSTTADSVGGSAWNGTIVSGGTLGGGWVTLDPNNYGVIQLPAGIVTNMDAVTVEAWVSNGVPAGWAQFFAFGNQDIDGNGMNYIAFQPFTGVATYPTAAALFGTGDPGNANSQNAVAALTTTGLQGTNIIVITNPLPTMLHLVCVFHPYAGIVAFYTNGVLCASNSNVSNPLVLTLNQDGDPFNLIGESLYDTDPFWSGAINEFRIYNGPLSAAQIMADYRLGPEQLIGTNKSVNLSCVLAPPASNGKYQVDLSWPTNSALVDLTTSRALVNGWTSLNVTNLVITNGTYRMTLLATNSPQFYRLQQY